MTPPVPAPSLLIVKNSTRSKHRILAVALVAATTSTPEPSDEPLTDAQIADNTAAAANGDPLPHMARRNDDQPRIRRERPENADIPAMLVELEEGAHFFNRYGDDEIQPGGVSTLRVPVGEFLAVALYDDAETRERDVVIVANQKPVEITFSR